MPNYLRQGADAFPAFRTAALSKAVSSALPGCPTLAVTATSVYFFSSNAPLDDVTLAQLDALLASNGSPLPADGFLVAPRLGTISPWCSKAVDALRACGFKTIQRIERAVHYRITTTAGEALPLADLTPALNLLHDRMSQHIYKDTHALAELFTEGSPQPGRVFDLLAGGKAVLEKANREMNLALSDEEIAYLYEAYLAAERNPTDTELLMFGQVNSEHCRHKIFNARWIIDGQERPETLFGMIKTTHAATPQGTLIAYKDNAGVLEGALAEPMRANPADGVYAFHTEQLDMVVKAETHNHPTAIAPHPGAGTGAGGEIRDEAATGTGAGSKAGFAGLMVSNLNLPNLPQPWEDERDSFPARMVTPLEIMLQGPLGAAAYGNEFGRPQVCGFFRTYEQTVDGIARGFHKPIMLAGGMGNIRHILIHKKPIPPGALIAQLGGPAMRIGLGGGAASSLDSDGGDQSLDFDSVQRAHPELQRRAQEVIAACAAMGADNPILSIHDIGAGGLSNGCPELVEATGATFDLRAVDNADPSLTPMEIWCCESQERYVLAIMPGQRDLLQSLARRERCPIAFIGTTRDDGRLVLEDPHFGNRPIDMSLDILLGKTPQLVRDVTSQSPAIAPLHLEGIRAADALERVLQHPAVADKSFLITGADQTAGGLVHRSQLVGPHQVAVSDCAITLTDHCGKHGEALALGERPPIALINPAASGRMAIAEALTNIAPAAAGDRQRIKLSANWMAACGEPGEDAALFETVQAVTRDFCPQLNLAIPVGKDSLSMRTMWQSPDTATRTQVAPLSLVISAFAPVPDVSLSITPDLKPGASRLALVDLSQGRNRLGGSILAQVHSQLGDDAPDIEDTSELARFYDTVQALLRERKLLAYHDRSDGGVVVTLAEMAMAGGRGVDAALPETTCPLAALFNEEAGAVLQIAERDAETVRAAFAAAGLAQAYHELGKVRDDHGFRVSVGTLPQIESDLTNLRRLWSSTSLAMRSLRDNPEFAQSEHEAALDANDPGMTFRLSYDVDEDIAAPFIASGSRPRLAILREQGTYGQNEMAAAFTLAGFEAVDVHMSDLIGAAAHLADFKGLVACAGASFGGALGAGAGWAGSILANPALAEMFGTFFARGDSFALGVGDGCQMLSRLASLIPGAEHWPRFEPNASDSFEGRYTTVEVMDSPSVLLRGMAGSRLPIAVAHAEGRAVFVDRQRAQLASRHAALRFVDNTGAATERYPFNPNGTEGGLTGFTAADGRVTIMMPLPERGFRSLQLSYRPAGQFVGEAGPWMRLFRNARHFVG